MNEIIFYVLLGCSILWDVFIFIILYLKKYRKSIYVSKNVRKYFLDKRLKIRNFVINDALKIFYVLLILEVFSIVINLWGACLLFALLSKFFTYYIIHCFTILGINLLFILFMIWNTVKNIKNMKYWQKINQKLSDDYLIENTIDLNTDYKQIQINNEFKQSYFIKNEKSKTFCIQYPKNFDKLTFQKQQQIVYNNSMFSFDNTSILNGDDLNINMFKDIFIKYKIIQK